MYNSTRLPDGRFPYCTGTVFWKGPDKFPNYSSSMVTYMMPPPRST